MSSSVLKSLQRLVTTVARRRASSSVASRCRYPLTDIDDNDQVVIVDSKRSSQQHADHIDRHVRSSGNECCNFLSAETTFAIGSECYSEFSLLGASVPWNFRSQAEQESRAIARKPRDAAVNFDLVCFTYRPFGTAPYVCRSAFRR